MSAPLVLRHLCFTGPDKEPALIVFQRGLNVLYGASETGKSFVLEAIDFMLGGRPPLRDIPERVGYTQVLLALEAADGEEFTLVRSVTGGSFQVYPGVHSIVPNEVEPEELRERHDPRREGSVSRFLLRRIGLDDKWVRKNVRNETKSLSIRALSHLCLIDEGRIQSRESPIEAGIPQDKTAEFSTFRLLLTGVDDRSLVAEAEEQQLTQSAASKLELIDEMISALEERMDDESEPHEIAQQLQKLDHSIAREQDSLRVSESKYQLLANRQRLTRKTLALGTERRSEVDDVLARFGLLKSHYQSDLARLEAIQEAGSLMAVLDAVMCPLCGASPQDQRPTSSDEDFEAVVEAAIAESAKVSLLAAELEQTMRQLSDEADELDASLPALSNQLCLIDQEFEVLSPDVESVRVAYSQLIDKRAELYSSLSVWEQLADLRGRRERLSGEAIETPSVGGGRNELSSSVLDGFSQVVESLLTDWDFPDAERVHFDEADRDVVISGKRRGSRGKGMRAITHAAFTLGLLRFCQLNDKPHLGFVILDSPLLAYREPEGVEDDLSGTEVQDKFYAYLGQWTDGQIVVIENTDPPEEVSVQPYAQFFSKNPHSGRYGFFPRPGDLESTLPAGDVATEV